MAYICIKKIEIPEVDKNKNPMLTNVPVDIGSKWNVATEQADEKGDIRLWSDDGIWWIDVSKKELKEFFHRTL